jgi:hypothetical protein
MSGTYNQRTLEFRVARPVRYHACVLRLGTPSGQSVHDYYPLAMVMDGGSLAPTAVELVNRLVILVVARRFPGITAAHDSRSLRSESYISVVEFVRAGIHTSFPYSFGWCAPGFHATPFCCSSWHVGFLSS